MRQKTEGTIVVGTASNVTIAVDPTGWFTGAGGVALDPTLAANHQAVEANIQASIRSFEDDDRNGKDDHGGGSGG